MMFSTVQDDVCMLMKFLSNSPIVHIAANTHPAVTNAAVVTIAANHNFAVNKWNQAAGKWLIFTNLYILNYIPIYFEMFTYLYSMKCSPTSILKCG